MVSIYTQGCLITAYPNNFQGGKRQTNECMFTQFVAKCWRKQTVNDALPQGFFLSPNDGPNVENQSQEDF